MKPRYGQLNTANHMLREENANLRRVLQGFVVVLPSSMVGYFNQAKDKTTGKGLYDYAKELIEV